MYPATTRLYGTSDLRYCHVCTQYTAGANIGSICLQVIHLYSHVKAAARAGLTWTTHSMPSPRSEYSCRCHKRGASDGRAGELSALHSGTTSGTGASAQRLTRARLACRPQSRQPMQRGRAFSSYGLSSGCRQCLDKGD